MTRFSHCYPTVELASGLHLKDDTFNVPESNQHVLMGLNGIISSDKLIVFIGKTL